MNKQDSLRAEVLMLGKNLLKKHKLRDWMFDYVEGGIEIKNQPDRKIAGVCLIEKKIIFINEWIIFNTTKENVKHVILHEIAHALVQEGNHSIEWRESLNKIGSPISDAVFKHLQQNDRNKN